MAIEGEQFEILHKCTEMPEWKLQCTLKSQIREWPRKG